MKVTSSTVALLSLVPLLTSALPTNTNKRSLSGTDFIFRRNHDAYAPKRDDDDDNEDDSDVSFEEI